MKQRLVVPFACALIVVACSACSAGVAQSGDGGAADGGSDPQDGATPQDGAAPEAGAPGCTPGAYVFCRCSDRSEGTKLCRADGQGFDPCSPCP